MIGYLNFNRTAEIGCFSVRYDIASDIKYRAVELNFHVYVLVSFRDLIVGTSQIVKC